jgi:hypothetical protein
MTDDRTQCREEAGPFGDRSSASARRGLLVSQVPAIGRINARRDPTNRVRRPPA